MQDYDGEAGNMRLSREDPAMAGLSHWLYAGTFGDLPAVHVG